MGCLRSIVRTIIIILAIIGFMSLTKGNFFKDFKMFEPASQDKMVKKSEKIADFSIIPDEYKIKKAINVANHCFVEIEHGATDQKAVFIDPNRSDWLTKEDFKNKKIDSKLNEFNEKTKDYFIHFENFEITKRGNMKTMGQTMPYILFSADSVNLPYGAVKGILGVTTNKDKKEIIVVSFNGNEKYSQIVTEALLNKIK